MARGINKVILIGNLGGDPDVRHMPSGSAVTNIRLATTEAWRDKQTGEQKERTEWHRVVFFNRLAEIVGEYLKTGSRVYVEGMLRTSKWRDNSNVERYTTEIVGSDMQILSSRQQGGHRSAGSSTKQYEDFGSASYQSASSVEERNSPLASSSRQGKVLAEANSTQTGDDDVPF